jgi:hypothetical protein
MATSLLSNHCSEEVDIGQNSLHKNTTARREWEAFIGFIPVEAVMTSMMHNNLIKSW